MKLINFVCRGNTVADYGLHTHLGIMMKLFKKFKCILGVLWIWLKIWVIKLIVALSPENQQWILPTDLWKFPSLIYSL